MSRTRCGSIGGHARPANRAAAPTPGRPRGGRRGARVRARGLTRVGRSDYSRPLIAPEWARQALAGAPAMKKLPGEDPRSALRAAGLLMFIPTLLVVAPLVGFFLGRLAERWLRVAPPWGAFAGLVLGFFAAGREIWAIIRRVQDEEGEGRR